MNKLKVLFVAMAAMVCSALAQTDSTAVAMPAPAQTDSVKAPEDYAFEHFYISIEGGEIYPWGDLQDAVENTLYGGVGIRYSYWENADGFMTFNYSYFRPVPRTKIDGVHQFSGKVGLEFRIKYIKPLVIGAGFACNFTRADMEDGVDISFEKDLGGTLADNETEFGWFVRLKLPLFNYEKFRVGFNAQWEELWTLPKRSDMMTMGLYIEREIW